MCAYAIQIMSENTYSPIILCTIYYLINFLYGRWTLGKNQFTERLTITAFCPAVSGVNSNNIEHIRRTIEQKRSSTGDIKMGFTHRPSVTFFTLISIKLIINCINITYWNRLDNIFVKSPLCRLLLRACCNKTRF